MRLKSGDQVMHEGEMYTVVRVVSTPDTPYHLIDAEGEPHPDGPFTKAQAKEWPVK